MSTIEGKNNEEREIYLSEYIQEQHKESNVLAIGLKSEDTGSEQLKITTKENTANLNVRPYLLVSYIETSNGSNLTAAKNIDVADTLLKIKYRNPVSNELEITHSSVLKNVTVYSLSGQYLFSQEVNDFSATVNVANLSAGTYIFKIEDDRQSISKIFIKE